MPNTPEIPGGFSDPYEKASIAPQQRRFEKLLRIWRPSPQQIEVYNRTRLSIVPYEIAIRSITFDLLTNAPAETLTKLDPYQDIYGFTIKNNSGDLTEVEIKARLKSKKVAYHHFKLGGNTIKFNRNGQISEITLAPYDSTPQQAHIQFPDARRMAIFDRRFGPEKFPVLPNGNCHYSSTPFPALAEKFVLNAVGEILPPRLAKS